MAETGYYFLQLHDHPDAAVARAGNDPERDRRLIEPGRVIDWSTLVLRAAAVTLSDYLANDAGVRLCSPLLRDIIDEKRGEKDHVQWLDALVINGAGGRHDYFVLHLETVPDVLDLDRSIKASDQFIVKPVVSRLRAEGHHVFGFAGATTRLIVSRELKTAIGRSCTGVDFAPVATY